MKTSFDTRNVIGTGTFNANVDGTTVLAPGSVRQLARVPKELAEILEGSTEKGDGTPVFVGGRFARSIRVEKDGSLAIGEKPLSDGEYILIGQEEKVEYLVQDVPSALIVLQETGCSVAVYGSDDNLPAVVQVFPSATPVVGYNSDIAAIGEIAPKVIDINSCGGDSEEIKVMANRIYDTVDEYYREGGDINIMLNTGKTTRIVPLWWALKRAKRPSWLVDKIIPAAPSLSILFSPSNMGKTYLVLDLALTIATRRREWFGYRAHGGKVLYLSGEGNSSFFSRVKCWMEQHSEVDPEQIDFVYDKVLFNFDNVLEYDEFLACLEKRCAEEKPVLVVVDTMNLYMASDENSTEEASNFLKVLKDFSHKINCAVLLVHHTGLKEQGRERGSSTIRGAVDSSIMLSDSNGIKKIEQVKSRNGEKIEPLYFVLEKHAVTGFSSDGDDDEDEEPVIDCIVHQIDPPHVSEFTKAELFLIDFCLERHDKHFDWKSFFRSEMIAYGKRVLSDASVSVTTQLNPRQKGKYLNSLLRDEVLRENTGLEEDIESSASGKIDEFYELVSEKIISTVEARIADQATNSDDTDNE